jgi:zinc transport system substrate-binding protein
MKLNAFFACIFAIFSFFPTLCLAELNVVVSVRPLYGIVASIMEGKGKPKLILQGNESPHTYALKPSNVSTVSEAHLVVWIGESYEVFLKKIIANQAKRDGLITAEKLSGIHLLHLRSGGVWGEHSHSHAHHDDHAHDTTTIDGHLWLDIANAKVIAQAVKEKLCQLDEKNAKDYEANLSKFLNKLDELNAELREALDPYAKKGFIVFHDSYQYFERAYNLTTLGSILVEPESPAQPYHVDLLLELLKNGHCHCIFSEPQFKADIAESLSVKTEIPMGLLDPLGTQIPLSSDHYLLLMRDMVAAIDKCVLKR